MKLPDGWSRLNSALTLEVDPPPFDTPQRRCWDRFVLDEPNDAHPGWLPPFPDGVRSRTALVDGGLKPDEALFDSASISAALNRRGQAFASWTRRCVRLRSGPGLQKVPLVLSSAGTASSST